MSFVLLRYFQIKAIKGEETFGVNREPSHSLLNVQGQEKDVKDFSV